MVSRTRTLGWLGIGFALLFSSATFAEAPKFGWKQTGSEVFSLNAGDFRYYRIALPGRWRFTFKADAAIYVGVVSAEQLERLKKKHLLLQHFSKFQCVKTSILEAVVACDVQPNATLAIRDKRGPITMAVGALSTVRGNKSVADRDTSPNKVTVTFYQWVCVENCPQ